MEIKVLAKKRRLRYGANAILLTGAVVLATVLLYGILDRRNLRWDLTANQDFSLSEQTLQVLKGLGQEVKIFAFFRRGEELDDVFIRRRVDDILKEYAARSSKISYRMVDPDPEIELAAQYNITTDGTVVFQSGAARKEIYRSQLFDYSKMSEASLPEFSGEGLFTNALLKVMQQKSTVICYLEGHGERSLEDTAPAGFSAARDYLTQNNYAVRSLSLVRQNKIPEDCGLLLIAGPKKQLPEVEEQLIQKDYAQGRPLLILGEASFEATQVEELPRILAALGLRWNAGVVLDPERHFLLGPHYPAPLLGDHVITKGLQEMNPIFSIAKSLTLTKKEGGAAPLLTSSEAAWGETRLTEGKEPKFDRGTDLPGPLTLGVTAPHAVVVGDADFASNGLIQAPGNLDLFLNMVGWLVGDQGQVTIRPKRPEFRNLSLTPERARLIAWFSQLGYPLLILGAGGVYWFRRKRR